MLLLMIEIMCQLMWNLERGRILLLPSAGLKAAAYGGTSVLKEPIQQSNSVLLTSRPKNHITNNMVAGTTQTYYLTLTCCHTKSLL